MKTVNVAKHMLALMKILVVNKSSYLFTFHAFINNKFNNNDIPHITSHTEMMFIANIQ